MRLIRRSTIPCLEKYLTKDECWNLIRQNRMKSIADLCNQSGISPSIFVLTGSLSLDKIYATRTDWDSFVSSMNTSLSDPSANALSHYLNHNNNRITTNTVFFTDSTSGINLLNPRFTYLVNKSNEKLRISFPEIHKEIKVVSNPVVAAEIENYYTEQSINVDFYLSVSYSGSSSPKQIKISPDVDAFITNLKSSLRGRASIDLTQDLSDQKTQAIRDSIIFYSNQISSLKNFQNQINPYIDSIDDILVGRKILNKNVLVKIMDIVPDSLQDTVYSVLKEGVLKDGSVKVNLSDKPIIGKSLNELLQNKEDSLYKRKIEYENQLGNSKDSSFNKESKSNLDSYIEALVNRLTDIYKFVTENPLNSKRSIPEDILTEFRNRNAKLFVLCPTSNDSHRCMYVAPIGNDLRNLKFNFNSAGTNQSQYSIQNGSLVVTTK